MRIPTPAVGLLTLALCITACTTPGVTTPNPSEPTPGPVTPADPDTGSTMGGPYWLTSTQENRTVSIDAAKMGRLSFQNGRILSTEGTVPDGMILAINGSIITLSAPEDLNVELAGELTLHYGADGEKPLHSVPLIIRALPNTSSTPTPTPDPEPVEPDPDLGKTLPPQTVILNWENQTRIISLKNLGLSFKNGRYLHVDNTSPELKTITGSGRTTIDEVMFSTILRTETERTYQVPVSYREENGRELLKTTFTVIHQPDPELVSTLNTWAPIEREMLKLVNEVRTNHTLNGKDVSGAGCIPEFWDFQLKPFKPMDSLRLAAWQQAYYTGLEGIPTDPSMKHLGHEQPNASSPRFYGNLLSERIERASKEVPDRMKAVTHRENLHFSEDPNHTAEDAVMGWIRSPGHCRGMMQPHLSHVGYAMWSGDGLNDLHPTSGNKRYVTNFAMVMALNTH